MNVRGDVRRRLTEVEAIYTYLPGFLLLVALTLAFATGPSVSGYDLSTGTYSAALLGLSAFAALWTTFVRGPFSARAQRCARASTSPG